MFPRLIYIKPSPPTELWVWSPPSEREEKGHTATVWKHSLIKCIDTDFVVLHMSVDSRYKYSQCY